jgi:hypothetical protein
LSRTPQLARERLRNQLLAGNGLASPVEVVRWMGAMQSQEKAIARWSVAQRTADGDADAVDQALADGSIIRTHVLRPTWHYVAADDLRWMLELTGPRVHQVNGHYYRQLGIDAALTKRIRGVLERALRDGEALTRAELAERMAWVSPEQRKSNYLLMVAELDLVICSGPPRGKQQTYALVDARAPRARSLPRDQALAELATRYFQSHGPATLKDLTWWSSLTMADARRAVEAAGLERIVVREREYWTTGDVRPARPRAPAAHLIQGYDEYVVAYRESKDVFGGAPSAAPIAGRSTPFLHAVVLDGRVIGHWRTAQRARGVAVEMHLGAKPDAKQARALEAAVARYSRFLGKPASVVITR